MNRVSKLEQFLKENNIDPNEQIDMVPSTNWYIGGNLGFFTIVDCIDETPLKNRYIVESDRLEVNVREIENKIKEFEKKNA